MSEDHPTLAAGALVRDGRVQTSAADGVALLRLNRPDKLNAFDDEQLEAFAAAVRWFLAAEDVRVGVLAASGRAFCVGGDITTFDALDAERAYPYTRRGYDMLRPLETGEKPLIAAVDGWCVAGGLEVALACDFIIAGEGARFAFGEVDLGLIPAYGGTVRLTRAIGARRARQMILTSERVAAPRARELGLVNEVVEAGGALRRALELADVIAAQPPLAVRAAKVAAEAGADGAPMETALAAERMAGALLFGTTDVHEQVRAWTARARDGGGAS